MIRFRTTQFNHVLVLSSKVFFQYTTPRDKFCCQRVRRHVDSEYKYL